MQEMEAIHMNFKYTIHCFIVMSFVLQTFNVESQNICFDTYIVFSDSVQYQIKSDSCENFIQIDIINFNESVFLFDSVNMEVSVVLDEFGMCIAFSNDPLYIASHSYVAVKALETNSHYIHYIYFDDYPILDNKLLKNCFHMDFAYTILDNISATPLIEIPEISLSQWANICDARLQFRIK